MRARMSCDLKKAYSPGCRMQHKDNRNVMTKNDYIIMSILCVVAIFVYYVSV